MKTTFVAVYRFVVKNGEEAAFEQAWTDLTNMIYADCGSNGSRLHSAGGGVYIAYAAWPDRASWAQSTSKLREESEGIRAIMRSCCEEVETLYELEPVRDLLKE
jgi:heme-degrading monooxygenase HmoA